MPLKLKNIIITAQKCVNEGVIQGREKADMVEQNRILCNYIYRHFYARDLDQIKPSRIMIDMGVNPRDEAWDAEDTIIAEIPHRLEELRALPKREVIEESLVFPGEKRKKSYYQEPEFYDFMISCLDEGLIKLERDFGFPRDRIMEVARQFQKIGYKNKWVSKTRRHIGSGCIAKLENELTNRDFTMDFVFYRDGVEIFRDQVMRTYTLEDGWYPGLTKIGIEYDRGDFVVRSWRHSVAKMLEGDTL